MSDIITKLERVKQTKSEIKEAIISKGSICDTSCFREFPSRILAIQVSSDAGNNGGGNGGAASAPQVPSSEPFDGVATPVFEYNNGTFNRSDSKSFVVRTSGLLSFVEGAVVLDAPNTSGKLYNDGIYCGYYADTAFTIEAYFSIHDIEAAKGTSYSQYAVSNFQSGGFTIGLSSEANGFKVMGSFYDTGISGYVNILNDRATVADEYIHVIMTVDSNNKISKCFFNGEKKEAVISGNYKSPTSNTQVALCANPYGYEYINQDFLNGTVKLVRYYNRVLTDEECLQNYHYVSSAKEPIASNLPIAEEATF